MIGVGLLIVVAGYIAYQSSKIQNAEFKRTGKRPKGYYMDICMAMGIAIGMPLGIAIGNIALDPAMGLPIGIAIGSYYEKNMKRN